MRLPLLTLAAFAVTGCAHNDVLVFGTSTTIGASVSAKPAEAGAPQIVIGYERQEGVWMPLRPVPQQPPSRPGGGHAWPDRPDPDARYASEVYDAEGRLVRRDALSVFASIGAHFSGEATANQPRAAAGGGLAQFFATGAAAVNLTQNEALVTVLRFDTSEVTRAQADAVEAAAGTEAARQAGIAEARAEIATVDQVLACAFPANASPRWSDIVGSMSISDEDRELLLSQSREGARLLLLNDTARMQAAATAVTALPACSGA